MSGIKSWLSHRLGFPRDGTSSISCWPWEQLGWDLAGLKPFPSYNLTGSMGSGVRSVRPRWLCFPGDSSQECPWRLWLSAHLFRGHSKSLANAATNDDNHHNVNNTWQLLRHYCLPSPCWVLGEHLCFDSVKVCSFDPMLEAEMCPLTKSNQLGAWFHGFTVAEGS